MRRADAPSMDPGLPRSAPVWPQKIIHGAGETEVVPAGAAVTFDEQDVTE